MLQRKLAWILVLLPVPGLLAQQTVDLPPTAPHYVISPAKTGISLINKVIPGFGLPTTEINILAIGQDNTLLFESHTKNNRLHGSWQSWYPGRRLLDEGKLENGVPHGEWRHWDSSGQLLAVRTYDAVKLRQAREEFRLNNTKRTFFPLTELYRKDPAGAWSQLQAVNSFPLPGNREMNLSLKEWVVLNVKDPSSYQPVFIECLHHGLYMNFFSNGQVKDSGYYKNGLRDGIWIHHTSPGGTYWLGAYLNGVRQKEWKKYSEDGRLLVIQAYDKKGNPSWRKEL